MCSAAGAQAGFGAIVGGTQATKQASLENRALRYNAWLKEQEASNAEIQASQTLKRGQTEEALFRKETEQIKGKQRASFGASGAVVDSGSTLDTLLDTAEFGELDALTIRRNAEIEAWQYNEQARIARSEKKRLLSQTKDPNEEFLMGALGGAFGGFASGGGFSSRSTNMRAQTHPRQRRFS